MKDPNRTRCRHLPPMTLFRWRAMLLSVAILQPCTKFDFAHGSSTNMSPQKNYRDVRHVRKTLNVDLGNVLSGKRSKDFARMYKQERDRIDLAYDTTMRNSIGGNSQRLVTHVLQDGNGMDGESIDMDDNSAEEADVNMKENSANLTIASTALTTLETPAKQVQHLNDDNMQETLQLIEKDDHLEPPSAFALLLRACRLGWNFAPCTSTAFLALCSERFRNLFWYKWMGQCLARSGPAFIKWGQWASTRSDMFPEELCTQLSILHAAAPAHSWKATQETVEEALNIPSGTLMDVFLTFEDQPLASGSIAQVHRAVLRPVNDNGNNQDSVESNHVTGTNAPSNSLEEKTKNRQTALHQQPRGGGRKGGTTVAVKVRHPKVARLMDLDFRLMLRLADLADRLPLLKWLDVRSTVEQFSHTMAAQAHLDVEAHHLEVLNHNFRRWSNVNFPRPFFASSAVIMETFERGEIVTTILDRYEENGSSHGATISAGEGEEGKVDNEGKEKGKVPIDFAEFLVTNGLSIYLKMLLEDNLMHADLHPGNIMVSAIQEGEGGVYDGEGSRNNGAAPAEIMSLGGSSNTPKFRGNMVLVDAGMVAKLDEEQSENFIGFLAALGEGDGYAAADAVLRFSPGSESPFFPNDKVFKTLEEQEDEKERREDAFRGDMAELFSDICRGYGTNVEVGNVLRGVLGLIRKHRVRIDANYATLVINALCVEGLAKRAAPDYNVLDASKPLLRSFRPTPMVQSRGLAVGGEGGGRNRGAVVLFKARQGALLRLLMPLMYLRKNMSDGKFWKRKRQRDGDDANNENSVVLKRVKRVVLKSVLLTTTIACTWALFDGSAPKAFVSCYPELAKSLKRSWAKLGSNEISLPARSGDDEAHTTPDEDENATSQQLMKTKAPVGLWALLFFFLYY